jgi:hypothetical protein
MKKFLFILTLCGLVFALVNCNPARTATGAVPKATYEADLAPVIMSNCSPCHIPAKGGNKKAYDNYGNVRTDIDEILRRIQLNPGEKGFMPFRKTEKLPDSIIQVFRKFRDDGTLER